MSFGKDLIFQVEARAMLEGLYSACDKGFRNLEVECDNALLVELFVFRGDVNSNLVELQLL